MSDHESGSSPTSHEAGTEPTGSFSTNGTDHGAIGIATEEIVGESGVDGTSFLADLAHAMQATAAADKARNAEGTEQRRQAHLDAIRAREALEAEDLRELAKEDVKGIDAWSDGEIKRVKLERERRIATRREQLQARLEEHRLVIGREVEAVEAAVAHYRGEIDLYFSRLESETDPVAIARYAGTRPAFPVLELIGPDDVPADAAVASAAIASEPAAIDHDDHDDQGNGSAPEKLVTETTLIGVMAPKSAEQPAAAPWAAAPVTTGAAKPAAEVTAPTDAVAEAVAATVSSESDGAHDAEKEPVGAVAEARVVMPRSSGAGSWLRWPNNPADRSDSTR